MSKRALRRHHYQRLKKKVLSHSALWWREEKDIRVIGLLTNTPKICSKPGCCGNPRILYGSTKQEKLHQLKFKEEATPLS